MHTTTTLLRACILGVALAATPALAQDAKPSSQDRQISDAPDAADSGESSPQSKESAPTVSPAAQSVARWFRAIGGRISMGPKFDHTTRISRPNLAAPEQGWRVSVPTFLHSRLVRPPARAQTFKTASEPTGDE